MYTKYLMAGYLVIFSTSMGVQFIGFILQNMVIFRAPAAGMPDESGSTPAG
jgi:hypothetical protein